MSDVICVVVQLREQQLEFFLWLIMNVHCKVVYFPCSNEICASTFIAVSIETDSILHPSFFFFKLSREKKHFEGVWVTYATGVQYQYLDSLSCE